MSIRALMAWPILFAVTLAGCEAAETAEAAPASSSVTIEVTSLEGTGITLPHSAGGQQVRFGTPRDEFMELAEPVFGVPTSQGDCENGQGQFAIFAESELTITFVDSRFSGWHSVQTTDDFLSMRRTWFVQEPNFAAGEATAEGVPYSYGEEGEEIAGLFADGSRDALVLWQRAGVTCAPA